MQFVLLLPVRFAMGLLWLTLTAWFFLSISNFLLISIFFRWHLFIPLPISVLILRLFPSSTFHGYIIIMTCSIDIKKLVWNFSFSYQEEAYGTIFLFNWHTTWGTKGDFLLFSVSIMRLLLLVLFANELVFILNANSMLSAYSSLQTKNCTLSIFEIYWKTSPWVILFYFIFFTKYVFTNKHSSFPFF